MSKAQFLITILLLPIITFSKSPDWIGNLGKSTTYSTVVYLTGFGMASFNVTEDECLQQAQDNASKNLIEGIRVSIRSEATTRMEETDAQLSSYFSSAVQSTSSLEVQGLQTETWYDKKKKMGYALAYVRRDALEKTYTNKAANIRRKIRDRITSGKQHHEQGGKTEALEEYLACYPLFRELEEVEVVLAASYSSMNQAFKELGGELSLDKVNITEVRKAVDQLVAQPIKNLDDLAWYLTYVLSKQIDKQNIDVMIIPLTYQDTRMGSPFARYFQQVMSLKTVETAKWSVVKQSAGGDAYATGESPVGYAINGTYWESPDGVKIIANLLKMPEGKVVAAAEAFVDVSIMQAANLDLKPQNFKNAYADQKHFRRDEVIGGGLMLDVWTDKGAENLIYTEAELMRIFIRVNIPCYIRLIYHLADGVRTMLLDSHYIDESKVNKVYEIPEPFECAPPFGAEVLQVFARTTEFEKVETKDVDGYDVLKEDLQKFLVNTRGMKRIKKDKKKILQAEKRIVITTMGK